MVIIPTLIQSSIAYKTQIVPNSYIIISRNHLFFTIIPRGYEPTILWTITTNYWCLPWHYELLLSITMHPTIGYSPHYYWDLLGGFLEFGYPQNACNLYWQIMTYPRKTWMICGYPQIIHVYMFFHNFSL